MDPPSQGPVSQQALDVDIPHTCQVVPSCFKALPEQNGSNHTRGSRRAMPATNAVEEHILTSPQRICTGAATGRAIARLAYQGGR